MAQKVLLFYKRLLGPGGAERQLLQEYLYWGERNIEASVCTYECHNAAIFGTPIGDIIEVSGNSNWERIRRLRDIVERAMPTVISVHSGVIDVYLACLGLGIPYIYHHNSPVLLTSGQEPIGFNSYFYRGAITKLAQRSPHMPAYLKHRRRLSIAGRVRTEAHAIAHWLALRNAKKVIVLSNRTGEEVLLLYGRRAQCAPGALTREIMQYRPRPGLKAELGLEGKRVILTIGRLSPEKRVDVLIGAFAQISGRDSDSVLVIGGEGPERQRLERLASGFGPRIRFLGFIREQDLWNYYAAADVFASPAWADFDISPFEALALGKPVVWSNEMEIPPALARSPNVFAAPPTLPEFGEALDAALHASVNDPELDLRPWLWASKFDSIYQDILPEMAESAGTAG